MMVLNIVCGVKINMLSGNSFITFQITFHSRERHGDNQEPPTSSTTIEPVVTNIKKVRLVPSFL